jgi:class I fructose-bisphosphate aldolase
MDIASLLGDDASLLLDHKATAFPKEILTIPGPNYINDVFTLTDRSPVVLRNLGTLYGHGRLGGTGYLSILPVDQGIEHSAAASFAPNPEYFDPARLCDLAIEAGCNAIASTLGTLGSVTRRYVHRIPFIVKINHNDLLRYPTSYGTPGGRSRCGRYWRHDLLRFGGVDSPN